MLGRQPRADLEQCLSIPCRQLIKDRPPRRVCQGPKNITQLRNHRQAFTCMSSRSDRCLTQLEPIAVRIPDDRDPYSVFHGLDRTHPDAALSQAVEKGVEVVDK